MEYFVFEMLIISTMSKRGVGSRFVASLVMENAVHKLLVLLGRGISCLFVN